MIKILTGLLLTLTLLNPVAQSKVSLKKPAFTVELTNNKVENIIPVLLKTS
jgi:hypothetical protein